MLKHLAKNSRRALFGFVGVSIVSGVLAGYRALAPVELHPEVPSKRLEVQQPHGLDWRSRINWVGKAVSLREMEILYATRNRQDWLPVGGWARDDKIARELDALRRMVRTADEAENYERLQKRFFRDSTSNN